MRQQWEIHLFFGLIISNFWVLGNEVGLDMPELYADAAFRLRVGLTARMLQ